MTLKHHARELTLRREQNKDCIFLWKILNNTCNKIYCSKCLDLSLFFHRASVSMNFMVYWVLISMVHWILVPWISWFNRYQYHEFPGSLGICFMNFMVHWELNQKNSWFIGCSFNEFHGSLGIKFPWISCLIGY